MDRDLVSGLIGFAIALVYLSAAADIPTSAIGDSVGAAGFPHMLGYTMAAVSALFVGFRLWMLRAGAPRFAPPDGVFASPARAFASAAGTVAICALFIFMFEPLGYLPAIALLILGLCLYQGLRFDVRLLAIAVGGSVALWLLFAQLLSVRMPAGIFGELI
jgi:hypothetical protein